MSKSSQKQKKSHRSDRSGRTHDVGEDQPWSEPVYDETNNRWYVWRLSPTGETEYDWLPADDRTPRTEIDDLTRRVGSLDVNQDAAYSPYSQDPQAGYSNPVAEGSEYSVSPRYTTDAPREHRSGKSKHKTQEGSSSYRHDPGRGTQDQSASTSGHREGKGKGRARSDDPDPSAVNVGTGQDYVDQSQAYGASDPYAAQAVQEAYDATPSVDASQYGAPSAYGSTASYQDPYPLQDEAYQAEAAQRAGSPQEEHITGTPGDFEEADPRYRVEPSWRFEPGAVFKILWSEPLGQTGAFVNQNVSDIRQDEVKRFYIGYRRFIIVATDEGHSTCVPILTYERKGCKKKGVHPSKHGIVYPKGSKPRLLKDEPNLGYNPVAVKMSAQEETLAKESRVNYSKLVTIEHNVKVYFIGTVDPKDFAICTFAVNECWEKKWQHASIKKPRKEDRRGHSHR